MSVNDNFDVIVVGAGPAGASAAIWLSRAGLSVAVLDKASFPRDKPCGEYLSPETQRIFTALGVLPELIRANPARLNGMRIWTEAGNGFQGDFSTEPTQPIYGLSLRRVVLDQILVDHARRHAAVVLEGFRVKQLHWKSGRVIGLEGEHDGRRYHLSARLIIGADGINSVVAQRLNLRRHHRWLRKVALVTHYDNLAGFAPYGEMFVGRGQYCGFAPLGGGRANVSVVVDATHVRNWSGDLSHLVDTQIREFSRLAMKLKGAERSSPIRAVGPLAVSAREVAVPGAVLIGDAAFFLDPFTGEGVCTALHNSELACELLTRYWTEAGPAPEFYREYAAVRERAFRRKWQLCSIIQLAIHQPRLMNFFTRRLAQQKRLADTMVGVTGDFRAPREVLSPGFFARLLLGFGKGSASKPTGYQPSMTIAEAEED